VSAQEEPLCVENSRERRGEIACSIIENKPLAGNLKEPLFCTLIALKPASVREQPLVLQALRSRLTVQWWLCRIESQTKVIWRPIRHGSETAAAPEAPKYSMGDTCYIPLA